MNILNYLDQPLLIGTYAIIAVIGVAHMNEMYGHRTPTTDKVAWWFLTVGALGVALFEMHAWYSDWPHIMFGIGGGMVAAMSALPKLRATIAERRAREKAVEHDRREHRDFA